MQMKLKVAVAAAIAVASGVALAQDMVVKIGHVAPISGAQAAYGKDNENGARMAIEDLNAAGVMIGGKQAKFELVAEDDAADPPQRPWRRTAFVQLLRPVLDQPRRLQQPVQTWLFFHQSSRQRH